MSRLNDRPNGRRPRAPKFPSARPQPARPLSQLLDEHESRWSREHRYGWPSDRVVASADVPADEWPAWTDASIWSLGREGSNHA